MAILCFSVHPSAVESVEGEVSHAKAKIYHLEPDPQGGKAYKLVYVVDVPREVFWKFKTDFDNRFLLTNKFIIEHRFIKRKGNTVITENEYTNAPDVRFRWRTTVFPSRYRLDFVLENPKACGQKFHYGHIQLTARGQKTQVSQVAYFDFFGVFFWVNYPWAGGMQSFLSYTARWEQETILRLRHNYYD
jgi:hypothetical protein